MAKIQENMGKVKGLANKAAGLFNFEQPEAPLTAWMLLEGKEYELVHFSTDTHQEVDEKGQPQSEVRGGQLRLTLGQAVGESLYGWMLRPWEKKSGEVVFRREGASSPLRIRFVDTYCVNFARNVDGNGGGVCTSLVLSAAELHFNDILLDNQW